MAYEQPGFSFSLPSDQDMTTLQFVPVSVQPAAATQGQGQGGAAVVVATGSTSNPVGVVQNNPYIGEAATIVNYGITKAKAQGTLAIGDPVGVGTNGVIKAVTGKYAFARALESAVAGDTFAILLGGLGVQ